MKKLIDFRIIFISMFIVAALALIVHLIFNVSYWIVAPIVLLAFLVNGIVAYFEDEAPGGFNNPKTENDDHEASK